MRNRKFAALQLLTLMALATLDKPQMHEVITGDVPPEPQKEPEKTPNGTSRYYFLYGDLVGVEYSEIAEFTCVATNKRNAQRKYQNFLKNQKK